MMLAGTALASSAFAAHTSLSTSLVDPQDAAPFTVLINGVSHRAHVRAGTLQIDDTVGEQKSCTFTLVNPFLNPLVGAAVRATYFAEVLFVGTLDKIVRSTDIAQAARLHACTCVDATQILVRHTLQRNFINTSVTQILDTLLDFELFGEGFTIGTVDLDPVLPLVDSQDGSVFDTLRKIADVTGQTMLVDADKRIHLRAISAVNAPFLIDEMSVEEATVDENREQYRNVQTVIVTGTVPSQATADTLVFTTTQTNDEQIAERLAIEGGTGRYEAVEKLTHPTSNVTSDLALLAESVATVLLAVSGTPQSILKCRTRRYGFLAGQLATVSLPLLGVADDWSIQRLSIHEEDGMHLTYELELMPSNLLRRAYESWLHIVRTGDIVVQMPGAVAPSIPHATVTFTSSGSWVVPANVSLVTLTARGSSGGGGGSSGSTRGRYGGGNGGNGGKAIASLTVLEGETLVLTIGNGGVGGTSGNGANGTDGTAGGVVKVERAGVEIVRANGGGKGIGAKSPDPWQVHTVVSGSAGAPGGGSGGIVTVGGGKIGGSGSFAYPAGGAAGIKGNIVIVY